MTTAKSEARVATRVGVIAAVIATSATLAVGFTRWGNIEARVETVENRIEQKADKSDVDAMRQDVREIRQRVDQIWDHLVERTRRQP